MQQRRQDDSWGVGDWIELADTVFDFGGAIVEFAVEVAFDVVEAAGSLLFSVLDVF